MVVAPFVFLDKSIPQNQQAVNTFFTKKNIFFNVDKWGRLCYTYTIKEEGHLTNQKGTSNEKAVC